MVKQAYPLTAPTGVRTDQVGYDGKKTRSNQSIENSILCLLRIWVYCKLTKPVIEGMWLRMIRKRGSLLPSFPLPLER